MTNKTNDDSYFEDDKTVSLDGLPKPPKPLLLKTSIILPLVALTILMVGSIVFMNVIKATL